MTDFTSVDPNSPVGSNAPDLPKVDLAQVPAPPQRRTPLKITVGAQDTDPYAGHALWGSKPAAAEATPDVDPYGDHPLWGEQPVREKSKRAIGAPESAGRGLLDSATFGGYPAIAGAIGAGETPEERKASQEGYEGGHWPSAVSELGALVKGLGELGFDHLIAPALGIKTKEEASKAYREVRDAAREEQDSAFQQNPKSYIAGQVGGALALPMGGAARAATGVGRALRGGAAGAAAGGLNELGGGISKGDDLPELGKDVAKGALMGGALGTAGGAAIEGVGAVARRGYDAIQGAISPARVAERRVGREFRNAIDEGSTGIDLPTAAAAQRSGMPVHNIDVGGPRTREMGRALANEYPAAAHVLEDPLARRIEDRGYRISDTTHRLFGGHLDSGADRIALQHAAVQVNRPAYARAYAAGDRSIGADPEMQRLMGSPIIQEAMTKALTTSKDRAIKDRMGAFNPRIKVTPDGRIEIYKGQKGVPVYPNVQYWDYVQRELRDMAEAAQRQSPSRASLIEGLRGDLNKVLDAEVPEFGAARFGAAQFFGAQDALDAGKKFIQLNADPREARRALAAMSQPERELFARGFADELSQAILRKNDWGTINRSFTSPLAREKIETALGAPRARELEAMLRAEMVARRTEQAILGNSTTARQLSAAERYTRQGASLAGHGAAGALGTFELLKEGDYSAKDIIMGAIILGSLRGGAQRIDARVARHMAELLASRNPADVARGAQTIAASPILFQALRRGTEAGSRVTERDAGPARVGAGFISAYEHIMSEGSGGHHDDHHQQQLEDVANQP